MKKKSTERFVEESIKIHKDKYNYSMVNYVSTKNNVQIICNIHGIFNQMPMQHLRGNGCPICGIEKRASKKRHTVESFTNKANIVHNNKFTYEKVVYKNNSTQIIITCPIHGNFLQTPSDHLIGYGCKQCASDKGRFSNDDFITKAKQVHGDLYNYDKVQYINTSTNVIITCPKHGDFIHTPNSHLNGTGCRKCKNTKGENQIYHWLKNNGFTDFIAEKTFDDLISPKSRKLRYDFYIPEHNMLIEFDGAQHFSPSAFGRGMSNEVQQTNYNKTIEYDKIKTEYALTNGYKLIRIRFDENVYERLNEVFGIVY